MFTPFFNFEAITILKLELCQDDVGSLFLRFFQNSSLLSEYFAMCAIVYENYEKYLACRQA